MQPGCWHIFHNSTPDTGLLKAIHYSAVCHQVNPDADSLQRLRALRGEATTASNIPADAAQESAPVSSGDEPTQSQPIAAADAQPAPAADGTGQQQEDSDEEALGGAKGMLMHLSTAMLLLRVTQQLDQCTPFSSSATRVPPDHGTMDNVRLLLLPTMTSHGASCWYSGAVSCVNLCSCTALHLCQALSCRALRGDKMCGLMFHAAWQSEAQS